MPKYGKLENRMYLAGITVNVHVGSQAERQGAWASCFLMWSFSTELWPFF